MTRGLMVALFALALLAAPLAAEADRPPRIPRIGVVYLSNVPVETFRSTPVVKALLEGLEELSWVEGRDFVLDARSARRDLDRVPNLVAALVAQKVDLMLSLTCGERFPTASWRWPFRVLILAFGVWMTHRSAWATDCMGGHAVSR